MNYAVKQGYPSHGREGVEWSNRPPVIIVSVRHLIDMKHKVLSGFIVQGALSHNDIKKDAYALFLLWDPPRSD